MTNYKLFSNSVATADGVTSFDVVADGHIISLWWSARITRAAVSSGRFELSFASSNGFTVNDTRNSIATFSWGSSGDVADEVAFNEQILFGDAPIPISMGERIFLHHLIDTAPTAMACTVYLLCDDKARTSRFRQ
jgi:hypothetical protein